MIRKIFYIFAIFVLFLNNAFSEVVKDFQIEGNERVSEKTIINFSGVKTNSDLQPTDFNKVIKNLYSTNFFEDVSLTFNGGILTIKVEEYPIVQSIVFNGIKAKKFKDAKISSSDKFDELIKLFFLK